MAPKSNVLKLITVMGFLWLLIIVLMNIFNSGHSYYYSKLENRIQQQQQQPAEIHILEPSEESTTLKPLNLLPSFVEEYTSNGKF